MPIDLQPDPRTGDECLRPNESGRYVATERGRSEAIKWPAVVGQSVHRRLSRDRFIEVPQHCPSVGLSGLVVFRVADQVLDKNASPYAVAGDRRPVNCWGESSLQRTAPRSERTDRP